MGQAEEAQLCEAAKTGDAAAARAALDAGASADCRDAQVRRGLCGAAALQSRRRCGAAALQLHALRDACAALMPAAPCLQYALTPLCWAAERGHPAVVTLLLERGAAVGAASKVWACPRRAPASCVWLRLRHARRCDGRRACSRSTTPCGRGTPSARRCCWTPAPPRTAQRTCGAPRRPARASARLTPPCRVQDGRRPLHFAAQYGQPACAALLLARGADAAALNNVRVRTRAPVLAARSAPPALPRRQRRRRSTARAMRRHATCCWKP